MKTFLKILLLFSFFSINLSISYAQNDLSVRYKNYPKNFITNADTIYTDFIVENKGNTTYLPGDTLFLSTRINGAYFGLNLSGKFTSKVLQKSFGPGDTLQFNTGFLVSKQSIIFFPGARTLKIEVLIWGKGRNSVNVSNGLIINDENVEDNICSVTYDPDATSNALLDLGVAFNNYSSEIPVVNDDTLLLDFTIKNYGPDNLLSGDTLYLSAEINDQIYGLAFSGTETPYILTSSLNSGDSISINPGFLIPELVFPFFPDDTMLNICIILWGKGINSVDITNRTFPLDIQPINNKYCFSYKKSVTTSIKSNISDNFLKIFPNPTNGKLQFLFSKSGNYNLSIMNNIGQIISSEHIINTLSFSADMTYFDNGIYFYSVFDEDGRIINSGKIFKM